MLTTEQARKSAKRLAEFVRADWGVRADTAALYAELLAVLDHVAGGPADDDEAVTAEWHNWRLADVKDERAFGAGVTTCYVCPHDDRFGLTELAGEWRLYSITTDEFDGTQTHLCDVRDRGHLRRLCADLGVPLMEAV